MDEVGARFDLPKRANNDLLSEKITGDPRVYHPIRQEELDFKVIEFGNTGLILQLYSFRHLDSTFDFVPEGSTSFSPETSAKYASILSFSLNCLYKFLNDPEQLKCNEIDISEDSWMFASTNTKLVHAIINLFSSHGHSELVDYDDNLKLIGINLYGYKNLKSDDSLIKYLDRVATRASINTIIHKVPIKEKQNKDSN